MRVIKIYYSPGRPWGRVISSNDLSSLAWQILVADVAYKWRNIVECGAAGYDLVLLRPDLHGLYMYVYGCVHTIAHTICDYVTIWKHFHLLPLWAKSIGNHHWTPHHKEPVIRSFDSVFGVSLTNLLKNKVVFRGKWNAMRLMWCHCYATERAAMECHDHVMLWTSVMIGDLCIKIRHIWHGLVITTNINPWVLITYPCPYTCFWHTCPQLFCLSATTTCPSLHGAFETYLKSTHIFGAIRLIFTFILTEILRKS